MNETINMVNVFSKDSQPVGHSNCILPDLICKRVITVLIITTIIWIKGLNARPASIILLSSLIALIIPMTKGIIPHKNKTKIKFKITAVVVFLTRELKYNPELISKIINHVTVINVKGITAGLRIPKKVKIII